jgi:hypothetical protein
VALVKPLHSGDPDMMHCSLARNRGSSAFLPLVLFGPPSVRSKYIRVQVKLSHDPQTRACDIAAWGVAVVIQAEVPNSSLQCCSNGSLHRVFACSAGGPGFDFRLRRFDLGCSMQRMYSRWLWSSPYTTIKGFA